MRPKHCLLLMALILAPACGGEPVGPATSAPQSESIATSPSPGPASSAGQVTATRAGTSCEAARAAWADDAAARGADAPKPPPEHDEELKNILNRGSYLNDCAVPESADVAICAAIVDGQARGVTVTLDYVAADPRSRSVEGGAQAQADCIAEAIGKMPFPSHETMSITKTRFAPTK
jgi:hypothetical protein